MNMFWQEAEERKDPRFAELQKSEIVQRPDWKNKTVPLSIHGDAVPVIQVGKPGTKSLDVTSHQSILAKNSSSLRVKQPVTAIFEQNKAPTTEAEVGAVLRWSYEALAAGRWPSMDHHGRRYDLDPTSAEAQLAGQSLAGGYCGVLYLIKSDLDYLPKSLGLRHYSANVPCDTCPCNKTGPPRMWPTNFNEDSG